MPQDQPIIHPTAEVAPDADLGPGTRIWHYAQVREGAILGSNCIVGKGAYVDLHVSIGSNVKIQNGVFVYRGVTVRDGVFLGPGAILTNDKTPRAINLDGTLQRDADWTAETTLIEYGASIGAGAVVVAGVTVGRFAMVGAGSVVTHDVPDHGLTYGNPARLEGFVCRCGKRLSVLETNLWRCTACDEHYEF